MIVSGNASLPVHRRARTDFGDIWQAYRDCPISARLRVLARYVLCPYSSLLGLFPSAGRILDVGCGDGLLLFLLSLEAKSRTYVGIDIDESKIAIARRARISNAEFLLGEVSTLPPDSYDCVSIVDVLYLLPKSRWAEFLEQSVRVLGKNGLLIVKEVTDEPHWKYWFAYLEEILAIKVIRMTKGNAPHFETSDIYRAHLEAAGTHVFRIERIDARRPVAHLVFLGRKRT